MANIDRLGQIQTDSTEVKTVARNLALTAAYEAASIVGGRALSYAYAHSDYELAARVDLRRFNYQRLPEKLVRLQKLHAAVVPLAEALVPYAVDAAMLAELQAKIEEAHAAFDATRLGVVARKAATHELKAEIGALKRFFEQRVDPLIASVRKAHPEFHARYTAARIVINRPGQPAGDEAETTPTAAAAAPSATPTALPLAA